MPQVSKVVTRVLPDPVGALRQISVLVQHNFSAVMRGE
jgi:hypothetical protein